MRERKLHLLIILGIYIITLLVITKNLDTPYLWFDEAGQFFIAKGLNHDSNPLGGEKGLSFVVKNNAYYNLDPGGFSILLHYWSKISNTHIWLRILPFLFFIGTVLLFIYLSYLWTKNLIIALLMGFAPILIAMVLNMGFEVRAYSMEGMGTILGLVALERLKNKISIMKLLFWSCIFSFFMTSRYSEFVIVFIVSVYILYLIYNSNLAVRQKYLTVFVYALPIVLTIVFIYAKVLVVQNKNIEPVNYLTYLSTDKSILFSPIRNFLYLGLVGFFMVLYLFRNRSLFIKKHIMPLTVALTVNILFLILSFLNKYPWDPFSHRCISMLLLTVACSVAYIGEILIQSFTKFETVKYYFIILSLITILYLRKDLLLIRQDCHNTYYDFIKTDFRNYHHIYVDRWESPCIRYLFEYGQLRAEKQGFYPNAFTFAKYHRHGFYNGEPNKAEFYKRQPKMNDLLEYDLLITPELFNQGSNWKWSLLKGTTNFYIKRN
ncbi:MAG: hypothetical protein Q8908_09885 [Bacteroidota bacterium]|nr:hypothetical protein [Bacteroidota bacterium]